jgi:hypothetical protein
MTQAYQFDVDLNENELDQRVIQNMIDENNQNKKGIEQKVHCIFNSDGKIHGLINV